MIVMPGLTIPALTVEHDRSRLLSDRGLNYTGEMDNS